MTRTIALVGIGKIARDQHIPAINGNPDWELAATVSRNASVDGIENFSAIEPLLEARPDIDTVSLALPAGPRFDYARKALQAGRHVMLEKPPGVTMAECVTLEKLARQQGVTLFASWHSREARGVAQAKAWLTENRLRCLHIVWKEDVRVWHPGQEWVWEPGGLGVFDPGINALSIMTEILPVPVHLMSATLETPANRQTPIAAAMSFAHPDGAEVLADFDWREPGEPIWEISLQGDSRTLQLSFARGSLDEEYQGLYQRMTELRNATAIDMDLSPLMHVADAFMSGRRVSVAPFEF
jgi:D-galactose 1-dehydrogenase